ncbi:MAG: zinc ribbon domain-containing protein [Anaerolineae bacterium]|nr:zinc ribbon domain-containing protein [Anaerolineae bacterium]
MKQLGLILVLFLLVLAGPSWAQETPTLENLEISLWPEFDRPDVLVIYRGAFEAGTSLPVPVDIRIPAAAGAPTAVAFVDQAGERFNQQYTTRVEDGALVVSFELSTLAFQLEYYLELSMDAAGRREFTYTYTADYPVDVLSVEFQVPPTAEEYAVQPAADSVSTEADGLLYHVAAAGSVEEGDTRSWVLTYNKADSDLTAGAVVQSQPPTPSPTTTGASGDSSTVVIFSIAFVALVGVGAGAFWLGRRTQVGAEETTPAARRSPSSLGRRAALYCHKCGAQLRADSDFCHKCGAEVRD